jgi:hypothetical protein
MATAYTINTPFRNYFFYKDEPNIAQPLTDGYLVFRDDTNHNNFLAVYSDVSNPDAPVQYPTVEIIISGETVQAVRLDGGGGITPIYLLPQPYFIQCYSVELGLQFNDAHYEGASFVPPEPPPAGDTGINNLILDGQFTYGIPASVPNVPITMTGWYVNTADSDRPGVAAFPAFSLGENSVPATPIYALHYTNTVAGDSINQAITYVRSLEQQTITMSFWAKSGFSTAIGVGYIQFFGSDGSPTIVVETPFDLTETWTQYRITYDIGSLAGKIIGAGNLLVFSIGMNSAPVDLFLTNVLVTAGSTLEDYPYQSAAQVWGIASKYALSVNGLPGWGLVADSVVDGAYQVSYRNAPVTALTRSSVKNALDLLFASNRLIGNAGVKATLDAANARWTLQNIIYADSLLGSQTTTTVITNGNATSGAILISLAVTPSVIGSTFSIFAYFSGTFGSSTGGIPAYVYLESGGIVIGYANILNPKSFNPTGLVINGAILNSTLTPITINVRWGSVGAETLIFQNIVAFTQFETAINLYVTESINSG